MLCTRFAPSPTGMLHLGNIRTALLSYLWAKNNQANFVLRVDDTDRVEQKYIDAIKTDLTWMGIEHNKEIFQSQRNEIYAKWLEICKEKGLVYPAYDTKEELDELRDKLSREKKAPVYKKRYAKESGTNPHWRFELPTLKIEWNDIIRGKISINLKSVSDPIVQKSDGSFTYMFTSVIDDIEEKISHILRGEDHVTNTAIQIYMFDKINNTQITYAHLPILLNKHGQRMSKRNKDESISDLRNEGFFPITLATQMVFLGKNELHICKTLDELSKYADLKYASSQIRWSKKEAMKIQNNLIRNLTKDEAAQYFGSEFEKWDIIKNEISFQDDFTHWKSVFEDKKTFSEESISFDKTLLDLKNITDWSQWIEQICENQERKIVLKKLRGILSGKKFGPTLVELLENIDIEITKYRLNKAL